MPLALAPILWTALLLENEELRKAQDWWAWWTLAHVGIPIWLAIFSGALLAWQQWLGIVPASAWLVAVFRIALRPTIATTAIGMFTYLVAQRKYALLALFAAVSTSAIYQTWQARRRSRQA